MTSLDCRQDGAKIGGQGRQGYLFNSTIKGIDEADAILIVGCNPRLESPVLNARIRQRWLSGDCEIGLIGEAADLTYDFDHVGTGPKELAGLSRKRSGFIKTLKDAERPMIIVGQGALAREDGAQVLRAAWRARLEGRRGQAGLERLQRAAYGRQPCGCARSGLPSGRGRLATWRRI